MLNRPFKQLLSQKNFLFLWISQLLSQLTINLVNFSILTHIYNTTKSSVAVSLLWLAYSLPAFLFGPFSGSIVDRFSRKRIMMAANLLQSMTVALYLLAGNRIFFLYSLAFLYSAFDQLYLPAQQASIPWLVAKPLYPVANGIFLLTQQASFLIGFGLGGILLSLMGPSPTIILSSVFLIMASMFVSRLPHDTERIKKSDVDTGLERFLADVADGYKLLKTHPGVRFPVVFIICLQTFITIIAIILPSFVSQALGLNLYHAGPVLVVPAALGALFTTLTLPKLLRHSRKKLIVENGLLTAALSIFALSFAGFLPGSLKIFVSMISAVGLGTSFTSALIPTNTLLQEQTPEEFRGRVYGILVFFMTISTTVPLIITSSLVDLVGSQIIMSLFAFTMLIAYLIIKQKGDHVLAGGFRI